MEAITAKMIPSWHLKTFNGGSKVYRYVCRECAKSFESGLYTIGLIKADCGLPVAGANDR